MILLFYPRGYLCLHPPTMSLGSWKPRALRTKVSKIQGESSDLTYDGQQDCHPQDVTCYGLLIGPQPSSAHSDVILKRSFLLNSY